MIQLEHDGRRDTFQQMECIANAPKYCVLETGAFYFDLLQNIHEATSRIWIQTMAFEHCHFSIAIIRALAQAADRGIDVRFIRDAYSQYVMDNTFNHLPLLQASDRQYKQFLQQQGLALITELQRAHVVLKTTNVPKFLLRRLPISGFIGRDHKKMAIIDDHAYVGGLNMTGLDAKRIDFMTKTDNLYVVSMLAELFLQTQFDVPQQDRSIACDIQTRILVDGGKPGQSIIMSTAYDLIDREQERLLLISPFSPSGMLRTKLNQAVQRGVHVEFMTSSKTSLSSVMQKASQFAHDMGNAPQQFVTSHARGIIHAKALLAYANHEAIVGSHNFDEMFVKFGTEEVALHTTDQMMKDELDSFSQMLRQ